KIRHLNRLKAHGFNKRAIEELIQSEGGEKNLEDLKLLFLTEDQEQAIDLRTKLHAILEPKEIGEKLAKITFNKKKFSISNKSPDEALHLLKGLALEIRKINPGEESQLNEAEREKIESLTGIMRYFFPNNEDIKNVLGVVETLADLSVKQKIGGKVWFIPLNNETRASAILEELSIFLERVINTPSPEAVKKLEIWLGKIQDAYTESSEISKNIGIILEKLEKKLEQNSNSESKVKAKPKQEPSQQPATEDPNPLSETPEEDGGGEQASAGDKNPMKPESQEDSGDSSAGGKNTSPNPAEGNDGTKGETETAT